MRAVWFVSAAGRFAYRLTRGNPMMWVSASPFVGLCFPRGKRSTTDDDVWVLALVGWDDVQRFCCQEARMRFQLESLILAQNERWRQA